MKNSGEIIGLDGKRYACSDTSQVNDTEAGKQEDPERQEDPKRRNPGGGHRGPITPDMRCNRAESLMQGIELDGDYAEKRTRICELIAELRESIKVPRPPVDLDTKAG